MFQFLGRRLSLRLQLVLHKVVLLQQDIGVNFKTMFRRILWLTTVTELLGRRAALRSLAAPGRPPGRDPVAHGFPYGFGLLQRRVFPLQG